MKRATSVIKSSEEASSQCGFIESDTEYHYNDPAITTPAENATFQALQNKLVEIKKEMPNAPTEEKNGVDEEVPQIDLFSGWHKEATVVTTKVESELTQTMTKTQQQSSSCTTRNHNDILIDDG